MTCPNCNSEMKYIEGSSDSRQEWRSEDYECQNPKCGKTYQRTVTFKTQSSLVESDELEEIK